MVIFWEEYWEKWVYRVKKGTDVYAFGSPQPARTFNSSSYRYGFNGQEKVDEMSVDGGDLDFGARVYDSRLGRFLSIDPCFREYAALTPYEFADNSPIQFIDRDGKYADPPTLVKTNYGTVALKKADGYTLEEILEELRKPLYPQNPAPVETPGVSSALRLPLTAVFCLMPMSIGQETSNWKLDMMKQEYARQHAKPEDIQIFTTDHSSLPEEYLMLVSQRLLNGTASEQDKLYRSEVRKRITGTNDKYVINPAHVLGPNYNPNKSVLPTNHETLWDSRSYYDEKSDTWWSVEGKGKKAVFHQFNGKNKGEYHYAGSSNGKNNKGADKIIPENAIPNDLKKIVGYN